MKATKTQKEVEVVRKEKQPVYTLELSHAEAKALYNLVSQSTNLLSQGLDEFDGLVVPDSKYGTIDWIVYNAIADLVEPELSKEDE